MKWYLTPVDFSFSRFRKDSTSVPAKYLSIKLSFFNYSWPDHANEFIHL